MYQVKVAEDAAKFIRRRDGRIQRQIIDHIAALIRNPRPRGYKKLHGYKDLYRIASGDYRIVYTIKEQRLLVLVIRVAHRKDVYQQLRG